MDLNNEIKLEKVNDLKESNKKINHERNKQSNKVFGITGSNIQLNFISEEINANINKTDNETTLLHNMKENKTISESDFNIEIYFNNIQKKREEEEEKEKQLVYLYNRFNNSYLNKKYENILVEIENRKYLFHKNSETSLKIYILKIRCLLKSVKEHYLKLIVIKDEKINLIDLLKIIAKIRKEFESLSEYIVPEYISTYEEITQVYAKYLLYLGFMSKLKEEYIKSMSYITLGVNLLKIFFIRRKVASNIKTYILYCQSLLILINYLIGDYNYITASFYCQILFNVLKATFKVIVKRKLPRKYYIKFLEYTGLNYLFTGVCLEQKEALYIYETCYSCYNQSNFFLRLIYNKVKLNKSYINAITIENNENTALSLSQFLIEKYKEILDKKNTLNKILQKNSKVIVKKEKMIDLEMIENMRNEKYKPIEDKIYNNILTQNTQNHIDKMDNELISIVYQQKDEQEKKQTTISPKSKKFLYNFELYNILMSNNFRKFIIKTNKLQFNNPIKEKQSIESLQRYLNKNIKISDNSDVQSYTTRKRNTRKLSDNSIDRKKLNLKLLEKDSFKNQQKIILNKNSIKKYSFKNKSLSSDNIFSLKNTIIKIKKDIPEKNEEISPFNTKNLNLSKSKRFIFEKNTSNKLFLSARIHSEKDLVKTLNIEKNLNKDYFKIIKKGKKESLFNNKNYRKIKNMNIKNVLKRDRWRNIPNFRYSNSYSVLENDFERKYLDKNILSPRYFQKVSYLDSLIVKELSFQKTILKLKGNSSKMYFGTYEKDLSLNKNNINSINVNNKQIKENAYKSFLILDNKANEEVKKLKLDDYKNKKQPTNLLDYPSNFFKIFNKYIKTSKEKIAEKLRVYSESSKNVKQNNETRLLNLNNGLKELKHIISYKNKQLKNFSFNKKFNIIN